MAAAGPGVGEAGLAGHGERGGAAPANAGGGRRNRQGSQRANVHGFHHRVGGAAAGRNALEHQRTGAVGAAPAYLHRAGALAAVDGATRYAPAVGSRRGAGGRVGTCRGRVAHQRGAADGGRAGGAGHGNAENIGRYLPTAAVVPHGHAQVVGRGAGIAAGRVEHERARNRAIARSRGGTRQVARLHCAGAAVEGCIERPAAVEQGAVHREHQRVGAVGLRGRNRNAQRLAFLDGVVAGGGNRRRQERGRRGGAGRNHQLQIAPGSTDEHLAPVDGAVFRYINRHHVQAVGGGAILGNAGIGVDGGKVARAGPKRNSRIIARVVGHRLRQRREAVRIGNVAVGRAEGVYQPVAIGIVGVIQGDGGIVLAHDGHGRIREHRRAVGNQRRGHAHVQGNGHVAPAPAPKGVINVGERVVARTQGKHSVVAVERHRQVHRLHVAAQIERLAGTLHGAARRSGRLHRVAQRPTPGSRHRADACSACPVVKLNLDVVGGGRDAIWILRRVQAIAVQIHRHLIAKGRCGGAVGIQIAVAHLAAQQVRCLRRASPQHQQHK